VDTAVSWSTRSYMISRNIINQENKKRATTIRKRKGIFKQANKKHGDYIYLWRRKSTQQNLLLYYRSHDWWLFYQSSIRNSIKNLQDFILNDEGYNHSVSSENKLTLDPRSLLRNDDVLFNKTLPNVEICRRAKCRRAKCRRATHNQYFT